MCTCTGCECVLYMSVCERTVRHATQWVLLEHEADEKPKPFFSVCVYQSLLQTQQHTRVHRLITNIHTHSCNYRLILQQVHTQHRELCTQLITSTENLTNTNTHTKLPSCQLARLISCFPGFSSCSVWQPRRGETIQEIWKVGVREKMCGEEKSQKEKERRREEKK